MCPNTNVWFSAQKYHFIYGLLSSLAGLIVRNTMRKDKHHWTTPEQRAWLDASFHDYVAAQSRGRYDKFWPKLVEDWFKVFPAHAPGPSDATDSEPEPNSGPDAPSESESDTPVEQVAGTTSKRKRGKAKAKPRKTAKNVVRQQPSTDKEMLAKKQGRIISKMKKQIKAYMHWNAPKSKPYRKNHNASLKLSVFGGPSSAPRRRLQATEIYSKLYYKDRILPVIQQKVKEMGETATPMITIIRETTSEVYTNEDAETKALVASKVAEAEALDLDGDNGADGLQRTPQEFQDAIDELPVYLDGVMRNIAHLTGLSASVIVGGLIPGANGAISSLSFHVGKNKLGHTFGQAFKEYDTTITQPFQQFLRNVYSSELRATRAVVTSARTQSLDGLERLEDHDGTSSRSPSQCPSLPQRHLSPPLRPSPPPLQPSPPPLRPSSPPFQPSSPSLRPLSPPPLRPFSPPPLRPSSPLLRPSPPIGLPSSSHAVTLPLLTVDSCPISSVDNTITPQTNMIDDNAPIIEQEMVPASRSPLPLILTPRLNQTVSVMLSIINTPNHESPSSDGVLSELSTPSATTTPVRPKPCPAFKAALQVQAAAEATARVAAETASRAAAEVMTTEVTATEVMTQLAPEVMVQVPAGIVIDADIGLIGPSSTDKVTGRRIRKLTDFGLRQAQEVAEKKEKAAKLSERKKKTPKDGGKSKGARVTKRTR